MRKIAVVTVARSDYGLYTPIFDEILSRSGLELQIIAAASHLSTRFGKTVDQIQADGYPLAATVEMTQEDDGPEAVNRATALGINGFSAAYSQLRPDILLLLGDRYEMHAAGLAAVPHLLPVAHIHGGEESEGAIDNVLRHSLTKLSHIHFASTELHAQRIRQMGEAAERVFVTGAPGIDRIKKSPVPPFSELLAALPSPLSRPYILATFHPVTTEPGEAYFQATAFLRAVSKSGMPTLLTMPNADTGGLEVRRAIADFRAKPGELVAVENLGARLYLTAMANACLVAGNSSSGIIEAASFGLPVVNVGDRQAGRARSGNVLDCGAGEASILEAITEALSEGFLAHCKKVPNIYGDGNAARRIVEVLEGLVLTPGFIRKTFQDQAILRG
ncbi:MAG: UDP-N-acetylglucosamine 2-epimerase (hydrolyzing) [Armatimonadetes bacterium]|nr:UDP-N-acetylglucosamine 2-epimerase (hydrolyzing) [Armatimonadota bacterium]